MQTKRFLPNVFYSPDFEGGASDGVNLDFENEGLDAPSGEDFENNDNAELVPDLDFEPDDDGNQPDMKEADTPDNLPVEPGSDDGDGDEPDSANADGDDNSTNDAQGEGIDPNLYLRAGQLGVSAEDVAKFADMGSGALEGYLSGLEAGSGEQQEGQEGVAKATPKADAFSVDPITVDWGEERGEFDELLVGNLDKIASDTQAGIENVMNVVTGIATELYEMIQGQQGESEAKQQETKQEKQTATLKARKSSSFAKGTKKTAKADRGLSPRQKAIRDIDEKFPGEFGE